MLILERYGIAGPISKSESNVADLVSVLVDNSNVEVEDGEYGTVMTKMSNDIKVRTIDPDV